jgi:metallo-beta-lactamase superfamily protein
MTRRASILMAMLLLVAAAASAQDVHSVLQASAKAMGLASLKTIQYSGSGWFSMIGQTYGLSEDWPHYEVNPYTRTIDYDATFSREEYTRRQGNYPTLGRVPMPEQRILTFLNGNFAWNVQADKVVPQMRPYLDGIPVSDLRQIEIMITPHGFLKAALAASDATAVSLPIVGAADYGLSQNGRKVTIVSFTVMGGKYRINGTINDQNLVELVDTWFPNPVYGDMNYEMRYTQYKDFGGVKFPTLLHVHQGDPRLNPAHNYYEIKVTSVETNVKVPIEPVPDAVRTASAPPLTVQTQKLADGVWLLGAANYNSLAMEFRDFVALVEAPVNEARSLAVINEVSRLVPDKQIKYVINTHHHFDHAGGLRTFLSQGTIIVTHETNKDYYLGILFHPGGWTLQPDRLAKYEPMYMISRRPAPIETVGGDTRITAPYVVTDGSRMMEVFHVLDVAYDLGDASYRQGNHSNDMLMVYLPKEKILVNADLYSPQAQGPAPAVPTAAMRTLYQNMLMLKLDVAQHVPIHGRVATNDEFLKLVGKTLSSEK